MNRIQLAGLIIAASTTLSAAAPAFASGYGPAPFYRPDVGAPTSQQGQSAQSIAAEEKAQRVDAQSYGGARETVSQAGSPEQTSGPHSIYFGR